MPKLKAVALVHDEVLQDPYPTNDKLIIDLPITSPGTTVETEISRAQLERLTPQMEELEAAGRIRWSVEAGEGDERSQEFGYEGLPMLSFLDTGTTPLSVGAGSSSGSVLTGVNLLGGQIKDHVMLGDPADADAWLRVDKNDADPVTSGDSNTGGYFEVELIDDTGNPQSVTVVAATGSDPYDPSFVPAKITLKTDFANGAHTWATLAGIANADGNFNAICKAVVDPVGGGDQITAAHALERSTGLLNGAGHSLVVGGVPADITFIDDTTVVFDIATFDAAWVAGDSVSVDLRTNNKLAQLTAILAA